MYQVLLSTLSLDDVSANPLLVSDPEGTLRGATFYQVEGGKIRSAGWFDTLDEAGLRALDIAPHVEHHQERWAMAAYDADGERAVYVKIEVG